jgi:hypothetical protein
MEQKMGVRRALVAGLDLGPSVEDGMAVAA